MNDFFSRNREEKKEEAKPVEEVKFDPQETVVLPSSPTVTQGQINRAIAILIKEGNSAEDADKIVQTSLLDNIKRWGFASLEEFKEN